MPGFNEYLNTDTFITSVVFNDEALEISFMETSKQSESVMEVGTIVFPITDDPEKLDICGAIQDALRDLIDRVYAERRAALGAVKQPVSQRDAIRERMQARGMERQAEAVDTSLDEG